MGSIHLVIRKNTLRGLRIGKVSRKAEKNRNETYVEGLRSATNNVKGKMITCI